MREFKSLVLMQLKDKLDWSFLKSKKQTIFKIVFDVLKFVIITAVIYLGFYVLSFLRLLSLLPGIPLEVMTLIFTMLLLLSIIVCTNSLKNSLYLSKDNFMLLTMPVSKSKLFLSKLIVYYIYELFRNIYYFLPVIIAYFMINVCPIYFYFWLLFAVIIYTMLVVSISSLLSIPALYISTWIKSQKWLDLSFVVLGIGLVVYFLINIILAIPDNFDLMGNWGTTFWEIQRFLKDFIQNFGLFKWILVGIVCDKYGTANLLFTGDQLLSLLIILLSIAVIMVSTYYLVRPLFFNMASKNFEFKKKQTKRKYGNLKLSPMLSNIKKEIILNYRTSEKFYTLVFVSIGLPLSILLLNKIYGAMDTRLSGTYMSIAFNIMMILLISLSSSSVIARSFSEEGTVAYLNKTNPQPYLQSLTAKIIINAVIYSISLLITVIIFASFVKLGIISTIIVYLLCESLYLGHLLYSAELDIMNPQNLEYATTGTHVNNKNESKSSMSAIVISAIFTFLTYFFISENANVVWTKLLFVAIAYLVLRIYLYTSKIKLYYKEKQ